MIHRSLAFRLSVWYTVLLGATFLLVGMATYFGLQQYLRANLRDTLGRRSEQVESVLRDLPRDGRSAEISREIETRVAPEFNNRFVRVIRAPRTQVYTSGMPADRSFDPRAIDRMTTAESANATAPFVEVDPAQHVMIRMIPVLTASGNYLVEFGVSTKPIELALGHLLIILALLLPVVVVCAAVGGYWLVNRALGPVDRLSLTAERISLQDPSQRLPVVPSGDALERLAISLNAMLDRLRDSLLTSRRFLADASHELRTPLTVIKGELEEMTRESRWTEAQLREQVGSVLEEVARLERLVAGLLVIARIDAGETAAKWVDIDLAELASNTAEHMRLMAEERGIHVDLTALKKTQVQGDRSRLKQVIVNLLDNAIRFTPPGGTISLRTASEDAGNVLEVSDTGVGIAQASIGLVFDRFFRADEARARDDGGAGLGLSIVKSICSAHGARIDVASRLGVGSCFRVIFPRRPIVVPRADTDAAPSVPKMGDACKGIEANF